MLKFPSTALLLTLPLAVFLSPDLSAHHPQERQTPAEDRKLVDERRIEEEKRDDLKPTQGVAEEEEQKKVRDPQQQTFDRLELAYLMDVIQKKFTYRYDACKAVVLILGVQDEYLDLNAQLAFLREKKILPKKFEKEFDVMQPLRKGLFATMIANALDIKGGILMRTFGVSERYAIKELAFQGIMPASNKNDLVAGDEFVVVLQEASKFYKKQTAQEVI